MLYDPSEHPLLGSAAAALEPKQLEAQARVAERVLRLRAPAFTGADGEAALDAVVLQINYQLALPVEKSLVASESRGARSVTYRQGAGGGLPPVCPAAARIVSGLPGNDYGVVRAR